MRKMLRIMIAVVLLICGVGLGTHIALSPSTDWRDIIRTWAMCASAIGSCGAVVIALFKDSMLAMINAPNLDLDVSNIAPYCTIENAMAGGSSKESGKFVEICAKVVNNGINPAVKCRVVCDAIYTMGADGKFSASTEHMFRPVTFSWSGTSSCDIDIASGLPGYVKIAEIRTRDSELGDESDPSVHKKTVEKPYMVVCLPDKSKRGKNVEFDVDCKNIILPVQLVCAGGKPKQKYVKIVWNGKTIGDYIKDQKKLAVIDIDASSEELPKKEG